MTTDLYLIRHGEAVANVEPIIGGMHGDTGLTDRGREQAKLLEERLRDDGLRADHLYVSTLPRALETGAYVARALQLPLQPDDELQELRPGEADGLSVEEWKTRYSVPDGSAAADPFEPFSPGGESWAGFLVRAGGALANLVRRHEGQTVVAVCHGGVLEASFFLAFGIGGTGTRVGFAPLNASITHWRYERDENFQEKWTLVKFNDSGHLAGEDVPEESAREAVPSPADEES
ncbi:MAG TPA: histidine phosphatase family protein [Propionibacteriaceae bacterium]|jgi:probable phosphoglycerate mutase|nr:histidine phosphatase family protein [Propionibacteriaceae bacterium]